MSARRLRPCVCDNAPRGHVAIPVPEESPIARAAARNLVLATQTYLTPQEAADYTRRPSVNAFRQWAYRERLPKCRMGRAVMYRRKDIDEKVQPEHLRIVNARRA